MSALDDDYETVVFSSSQISDLYPKPPTPVHRGQSIGQNQPNSEILQSSLVRLLELQRLRPHKAQLETRQSTNDYVFVPDGFSGGQTHSHLKMGKTSRKSEVAWLRISRPLASIRAGNNGRLEVLHLHLYGLGRVSHGSYNFLQDTHIAGKIGVNVE